MGERSKSSLRGLRTRVARALETGQRGRVVLSQLDTLAREAPVGSEEGLFAHRQLAELRMDESPWRAALHLRHIVRAGAPDDGVHALMGLCLALLGSFRAAVASYRRALKLSPDNPWYHHNLGHLLDVGLDQPRTALAHLRRAHELASRERAIAESLAHCLTRLGEAQEARTIEALVAKSAEPAATAPRREASTRRGVARTTRPRRAREDQSGGL